MTTKQMSVHCVAYLSDEFDLNSFSAQLFMYNFNCNATFGCDYNTQTTTFTQK